MLDFRSRAAPRATLNAGLLILILVTTGTVLQALLHLPLEQLVSPADILGLALGSILSLSAIVAIRVMAIGDRRILAGISGLFLVLAIGEYLLDSGPVDVPIALLWLIPGVFLAVSRLAGPAFNSARLCFLVGTCIELVELGRSILAATVYGDATQPDIFQWVESESDLILRATYLLGFIEMMVRAERTAHPLFQPAAGEGYGAAATVPGANLYERVQGFVHDQRASSMIRSFMIAGAQLGYARYKLRHPWATHADYYVANVSRNLDAGQGHPTLGKLRRFKKRPLTQIRSITTDEHRQRGVRQFEFVLGLGLQPHHVCVDYGCGSLRVGQHAIAYLESRHYWGLDVSDRFYLDGLDLLPEGLNETKHPNLRVISTDTIAEAAADRPDFVLLFRGAHSHSTL